MKMTEKIAVVVPPVVVVADMMQNVAEFMKEVPFRVFLKRLRIDSNKEKRLLLVSVRLVAMGAYSMSVLGVTG